MSTTRSKSENKAETINAGDHYEQNILREQNLAENLEKLKTQAAEKTEEAIKHVAKTQAEEDDEMLDGVLEDLENLEKRDLVEKLKTAKKWRNKNARMAKSKAIVNQTNVQNLTAKLTQAEKEKKILKDRCEYLYNLCKSNGITVDFEKYNREIEEKKREREFLAKNLY